MAIELSTIEVELLIDSLPHAKRFKQEGTASPGQKKDDTAAIDQLLIKLRAERKSLAASRS